MNKRVEDNICEAIELIVDKKINKANFDKTIIGIVDFCTDATIGKYKIKYQDSSFYAYSNNIEIQYKKGESVYILIPNNDFSEEKTILSAVKKDSSLYVNNVEQENKFISVGQNFYLKNELFELPLETTKDITINKDEMLDAEQIKSYLNNSTHLYLSADFSSQINDSLNKKEDFGLIATLIFKDEVSGGEKAKDYILNVNDMNGNPYDLTSFTKQYKFFPIDGKNFIRIESIKIFSKDLEGLRSIKVKNVQVLGKRILNNQELNTGFINLLSPQGLFFLDGAKEDDTLPVIAEVNVKGQKINETAQNIDFYWFKENLLVDKKDYRFNPIGGAGWECLNDYNVIESENNIIKKVDWVASKSSFNIKKKDTLVKNTTFKCVAVVNNEQYSSSFIVQNLDKNIIDFSLISENGNIYYYGNGELKLNCSLKQEGYDYYWGFEDYQGNFHFLENEKQSSLVSDVNEIIDFSIFKCGIAKRNVENQLEYLGTASCKIENRLKTEGTYSLLIENGDQAFKYDACGLSPSHPSKRIRKKCKSLTFSLYDNLGRKISQDKNNISVQWEVPTENTLLVVPEADKTSNVLNFSIEDNFDVKKDNNDISLTVSYRDLTLKTKTTFNFTKEKNENLDSVQLSCRLELNACEEDKDMLPCMIVTDEVCYWNFRGEDKELFPIWREGAKNPFPIKKYDEKDPIFFKLYKNGEEIFSTHDGDGSKVYESNELKKAGLKNIKTNWKILKNEDSDNSNLSLKRFTSAPAYRRLIYKDSPDDNLCNCFKLEVVCEDNTGKTYFLHKVLPIPIINLQNTDYSIELDKTSGFQEVIFEKDGKNPSYNKNNPFRVQVKKIVEQVPQENDTNVYTYNWDLKGVLGLAGEQKNLFFLEDEKLKTNEAFVQSALSYDGHLLSDRLECSIKNSMKEEIGQIIIPIHLEINSDGLSMLNGWDGNSIKINDKDHYILTPQMGIGRMEEIEGAEGKTTAFSGLLMGESIEGKEVRKGILGYSKGQRSIFLDSDNGKAEFGIEDNKIIIDPSDKESSGIRYGTKFIVDGNGNLQSSSGNIAGWTITQEALKYESGPKKDGEKTTKDFILISPKEGIKLKRIIEFSDSNTPPKEIYTNLNINGTFESSSADILADFKTGSTIGGWYINANDNFLTNENDKTLRRIIFDSKTGTIKQEQPEGAESFNNQWLLSADGKAFFENVQLKDVYIKEYVENQEKIYSLIDWIKEKFKQEKITNDLQISDTIITDKNKKEIYLNGKIYVEKQSENMGQKHFGKTGIVTFKDGEVKKSLEFVNGICIDIKEEKVII